MAVLVVLLAWCSSVGRQDAWGHQTTHPSEDVARPSVAEEPGTRMPLPPLRIRGDWNYPPFEFLDAQGQPDGFNIDIVRAVARVMNLEITVDLGPWDEVRRQLETGAIDALAGMFRTPERDRRVDFTIPHLIVSYAVFVRQDSPVQSLEDLADKRILVQSGDLGHDYVRENRLGAEVITRREWVEVLASLDRGEGDGAIVSRLQGMHLIQQQGLSNLRTVGPPLFQRKYCIATAEGDSNLLFALNEGLSIIKTTGEYDRLYEKWFSVFEERPFSFREALAYIGWRVLPLAALALLIVGWTWSLRRRVRARTRDLHSELQERRKAEAALRESEARFRRLMENAQDIIFRMSLPDGRFEYINSAVSAVLGHGPEELMTTPEIFHDAVHPDSRETVEAVWADLRKGVVPPACEYRVRHRAGGTRWLYQRHAVVRDAADRPIAVEAILTDITDRKLAEEERRHLESQLHRAEKMETLGTLAGGVAHDLNNVLGAVVGYPDLLLEDVPEESPLRKALVAIKESGEKAALIVQDLLTLARRAVPTAEVVDLNRIVTGHLDSLDHRKLLQQYPGVSVGRRLADPLLPVLGSPIHLTKIVMNLTINAVESMPGRGEVRISTANVYLDRAVRGYDTVAEGDYVVLTVADSGVGMTEADLKHVFEPFYTKKTMGRSGSGLGMAVVWGAVKDHRGYIDIRSRPGQGTTVAVYLPVTRGAPPPSGEARDTGERRGGGERILVVDDIAAQRALAVSMLEKLGYRAESAESGEAALARVREQPFDLLILDMIMEPGMDGLETFQRIRAHTPGQKAILASGFSETDRVRRALDLGAAAYLKKPFTLPDLARVVEQALGQ